MKSYSYKCLVWYIQQNMSAKVNIYVQQLFGGNVKTKPYRGHPERVRSCRRHRRSNSTGKR